MLTGPLLRARSSAGLVMADQDPLPQFRLAPVLIFPPSVRMTRTPLPASTSRASTSKAHLYEIWKPGCGELCFRWLESASRRSNPQGPPGNRRQEDHPSQMPRRHHGAGAPSGESALRLESRDDHSRPPSAGPLRPVCSAPSTRRVMDAFSRHRSPIGMAPGLAAMAPGVAGALITTVGGLLIAIPAMFGCNFLVHQRALHDRAGG